MRIRKIVRPGLPIAAFAIAGMTALAACGGSGTTTSANVGPAGEFGKVPAAATGTQHTGTITVAFAPGATPTWILPISPSANGSVYNTYNFQYEQWRPLYWLVNGVAPKEYPSLSLAQDPVWSNSDKTVTIHMKTNYKWSDGQPVTAKDAEFWLDELKAAVTVSPANYGNYTPGLGIPDQITSMSTPDNSTLVININKSVNPTWFWQNEIASVVPMPSHVWAKASASGPVLDFTNPANAVKIYNYLAAQSKALSTYTSNPLWKVVDGPYTLSSFNNTSGAFTMQPNNKYSGPHAQKISAFQGVPFTSDDAEFNAIKSGSVDAGYVPLTDLPQISQVEKKYNVFGYPDFGWSYVAYNFKDTTGDFNNIIKQLYFRQAFAHLEDQQGYIKAFFHGAGGQAYGPVPSIPESPFTPSNAMTNPYPFSVDSAVSILKSHGWTVTPGGTDVCKTAGTGSGQCGADIPAGTKLAFNLIYTTNPGIIPEQVTDLASQAKKAGINISLQSSNFNYMIANYNVVSAPKNDNKWAMEDFGGFTNSTYPTTFGVFNSTGSFNEGGYADPQADKLIQASIT
ncbi:MAG TPA: ABC transporter substrate-binding protein, partial [Streptosporangiaceae bacterium]|nr:ABC transporter substrate-binding protein [Streptosporangiaceae bacterium]